MVQQHEVVAVGRQFFLSHVRRVDETLVKAFIFDSQQHVNLVNVDLQLEQSVLSAAFRLVHNQHEHSVPQVLGNALVVIVVVVVRHEMDTVQGLSRVQTELIARFEEEQFLIVNLFVLERKMLETDLPIEEFFSFLFVFHSDSFRVSAVSFSGSLGERALRMGVFQAGSFVV